ncbi:hypothetical protein IC757_12860 [Wenzhouxiangella sp. AB-CW3]|uniref:hypothetical protein n=1 Tax=Wenzhouxiangella sp. AB-CW3 TaxID=2771012 RepID=UPI00168A8306|nr:hypothetical protein [Wenzhouxiangella sp. AB-CW3]QOC21912.1 hypothetical protein IC757_12860 [Wenzhouxiangella sp. AB-CW3]
MSRHRLSTVLILILSLTMGCMGGLPRVSTDTLRVSIDSLERTEDHLVINLALRNLQERELAYKALEIQLELDGTKLAGTRHEMPFELPARSREVIRIETTGSSAGLEHLNKLSEGQRQSLPWTLELGMIGERGPTRSVEYEGWLHAVPGQINRFR